MKTADLVFDRLRDWGVSMIFGMPGDDINGLIEALRTPQKPHNRTVRRLCNKSSRCCLNGTSEPSPSGHTELPA